MQANRWARKGDGRGRQFPLLLVMTAVLLLSSGMAVGEEVSESASKYLATEIPLIVNDEIAAGHIHGAVVVAGLSGQVTFRGAFGYRMVKPRPEPMTLDTIFDLASLTKVVATTTAIMQLRELGMLDLREPVARYWPEFARNGKASITVSDLLTHYSGLPPDLPTPQNYSDYASALRETADLTLSAGSKHQFSYSDVDFVVLGEIIRRVTGETLDRYCARHVFGPLAMRSTGFGITSQQQSKTAPADIEAGHLIWGLVQDPMARRMGGIAGHAGLFSTADDLTRFVRMLLNGGAYHDHRILTAASVRAMTRPQSPPGQAALRGYGWDIDSPYSILFSPSFSPASYGHTGYTGTAIWVDPESRSFIIVLTNRLHPDGSGSARMLEQRLAAAVGEAAGKQMHRETVKLGIDTLEAYDFRPLLGRRVGLLSHSAGRDAAGHRTADILAHAKGVILAALFSPEHGFASASEQKVATQLDAETGLPVYSLYGDSLRPTDAMLQKLDAVVIDLQDVGARYYTYATTMAYMMEDAAQHGLEVYVLDRPNPIGNAVQGPMLDADQRSFTGYWPMPVRHGMTLGELAQMFNEMAGINVKLHVVSMRSYRRNMMFAGTGLNWIPPSPNLPSASAALLYAGVGLVEGANISVGRGTPTPFELVGAPWIDGDRLTSTLAARNLPGIRLQSANFIPDKDIYANQPCHGSRIQVTDPMVADLPRLGIEIIAALYRLYPRRFDVAATAKIIGSAMTFREIENGTPPDEIAADWRSNLSAFAAEREKFLIYPKGE